MAEPIRSLIYTHIQPPLLNTIYLVAYQFGEHGSLVTQLLYFLIVACTVALIPITVRLAGMSRSMSMISGIIFALLPATTLYSLWPYSTSLVSFFAVSSIFGIALLKKRPRLGLLISFSGMFLMFLTRPTFNWVFVLAWVLAVSIYALKCGKANFQFVTVTASGFVIFTLLIQGHYFISFGAQSLSTWAGENVSRSLVFQGLTEEGRTALASQNACFSDLINSGVWQPPSAYPNCLEDADVSKRGALVWDEPNLPNRENNLNYGGRLPLADKWTELDIAALRLDPLSVPRFVFGPDFSSGTLWIYLSPPEDHPYPQRNFSEFPALWSPLRYISLVLPVLAWTLIAISLVALSIRRFRPRTLPTLGTYFFGITALFAHGLVSILGDFGENMRFRGELDGVLIIVSATGASILLRWRDQQKEIAHFKTKHETVHEID